MMNKQFDTLDLFAGVGGIKLAFEDAGFKTVFANDFAFNCKKTYDLNSTNIKLHIEDVNQLDISKLPHFDILLGGFPCQPFSVAGYRQGFQDNKDRGNLFFRIANIIKERRPLAILLENVKNLKGHDKGKTFQIIEKTLEELGYYIKSEILNGIIHGNIPQNRERIFIVAFLNKNQMEKFNFPAPIPLIISFKDLLENQVSDKYYYNNKPLYEKIKNDIISENTIYQWRRKYVRSNKKNVCPTLTANMGRGGHNVPIIKDDKGIRKLTPKECFLLQGFPKNFKLPKDLGDNELYHQAGNSVIVPVVNRIAKEMNRVLSFY